MLPPQNSPLFRYSLDSALLGPRRLRYEPVGGDQLSIALHRDTKTHGLNADYSAALSFVKDGRAYVNRAYQAAGIEANVRALVEQYDTKLFEWLPYYRGRLNYTEAEFSATDTKLNVEQQSFLQKFQSRDSVDVDLFSGESVSGTAGPIHLPQTVELHSRAVLQRYAASQKTAVTTSAQMYGDEGDPSHEQLLYFGFDTQEINEMNLGAVAGGWVVGGPNDYAPIYTADGAGRFVIELDLRARIEAHNFGSGPEFETVDGSCVLILKRAGVSTVYDLMPRVHVENLGGDYVGDLLTGAQKFTVDLAIGDEISLFGDYWMHDIGGLGTGIRYRTTISAETLPGSYLRITAETQTPATNTKGLLLYEALERVCQALTDENDAFRSDFFGRTDSSRPYPVDGPGALTLLTGGFQVRGFPLLTDPAPADGATDLRKTLTTTWRELFDSLAAVYGLGWGREWAINDKGRLIEVIRVEPLAYFYSKDVVLDLSEAGNLEVKTKVAAALHYQVAEVGYDQWQAEQTNGLDEFNARRQWTTPLTTLENTYSQISRLSASGILLEATRRDRFDEKATTDTSRDASNFLVCLLRENDQLVTERNQLAVTLSGIISPATVYNLRLRPSRVLRRAHSAVLAAGIKPLPTATVRTTSGDGNGALLCRLTDEPAATLESADVLLSELAPPLWMPEQDTMSAPVSREQLQALLTKPAGRVRYRDDTGLLREGWILDFKHTARERTGDFTLLRCA